MRDWPKVTGVRHRNSKWGTHVSTSDMNPVISVPEWYEDRCMNLHCVQIVWAETTCAYYRGYRVIKETQHKRCIGECEYDWLKR